MNTPLAPEIGFPVQNDRTKWKALSQKDWAEFRRLIGELAPKTALRSAEIECAYAEDEGDRDLEEHWEKIRFRRECILESLKEMPLPVLVQRELYRDALTHLLTWHLAEEVRDQMNERSKKPVLLGAIFERAQSQSQWDDDQWLFGYASELQKYLAEEIPEIPHYASQVNMYSIVHRVQKRLIELSRQVTHTRRKD